MKKHLVVLILIALIGLSGASSEKKLDMQVGYNFGSTNFNQDIDPSGQESMVMIKDGSFQPSVLTVPIGTTVEWHNQDGVQHSVVSNIQGLFDSGILTSGEKYAYNFNAPGSYDYHCGIHTGMQGTITVTGVAARQVSSSIVNPGGQAAGQAAGETGLAKAGSAGSGAAWSEKPLSLSGQVNAVGLQSGIEDASAASGLLFQANPILEQSAALTSGQSLGKSAGQSSSQISLQKFSQYYHSASEAPEEQLTAPTKIELNEVQPTTLYFGAAQKAVPYAQYQTYALSTGANSLWIFGASSWTQYAMVPLGSMLNMIAMSPAGGNGYLYEIYPDGSLDTNSFYFYPYNQIGFYADEVGEHQLFFNIAGQPSNVIVIDVVPYQQPAVPIYNLAAITISSTWLRGYNVYVDGSYRATEGMTGDPAGIVTINVLGDQYHNIAIDSTGLTFSDYKYFKAGYAYQLNV
jgi:plastocyanin